jgi:putative ABC transport system substrate-binding protein
MKRREFITLLTGTAIAGPRAAIAQTASKIYRVGVLSPGPPIDEKSPIALTLLQVLEKRGYTRGKNLEFESRGAGGQMNKLGEIVREMKASQVDVIVGGGFPTALACKVANVPTVIYIGAGDPVATHLIDSLAHPGGSITGISDNATALASKRLSLIKQAVPKLKKVAMLWNRDDLGMSMRYEASATAARSLGTTVQALGVREPDDFKGVFEAMDRDPPDAIFMVADGLTTLNRKRVIDYAAMHHIPAMYEYDVPNVTDGGLMSYGPDVKECMVSAAELAARILGGAQPGDLPFEEPTHYKLVINLKTAKATGIELPVNFLALADEVIE